MSVVVKLINEHSALSITSTNLRKNPIKKVSAPRRPERPLNTVKVGEVSILLGSCDSSTFYGTRDKAIFMTLLDTGVRASETLGIDIEDLNLIDGSILIRNGMGSKVRTVFIGKKSKKAIRIWL